MCELSLLIHKASIGLLRDTTRWSINSLFRSKPLFLILTNLLSLTCFIYIPFDYEKKNILGSEAMQTSLVPNEVTGVFAHFSMLIRAF